MALLNLPHQKSRESLTGYIQRLSEANYISNHELWRFINKPNGRYPQTSMAPLIDYIPTSVMDLSRICMLTNLSLDKIKSMTFEIVINKLLPKEMNDKQKLDKRILMTLLDTNRKICPLCLQADPFYPLIWQVKEIDICLVHKTELIEKCPRCNANIKLLAVNSRVGICDICGYHITDYEPIPVQVGDDKLRAYEDWTYLMNNSCSTQQQWSTAVKLMYVLSGFRSTFSWDYTTNSINKTTIMAILQSARDTRKYKSYTHLGIVFKVIRDLNISYDEFTNIVVPNSFVDSIMKKKVAQKYQYACQAPWCTHYLKPGSLERTSTSKKQKGDVIYNYYMFCKSCGIEYAIDQNTKRIVERGYYISLAWESVKPLLYEGFSRRQIAKKLRVTLDKILRCTIYLYSNGLISKELLNFDLLHEKDELIKQAILDSIQANKKAKDIPSLLGITYAEFLLYWLSKEVIIERIKKFIPRVKQRAKYDTKI